MDILRLASLCLAAGALALTVYTAVRFTGLLLCAAAGALTVLGLLRLSKTHPWARWARRIALGLLARGSPCLPHWRSGPVLGPDGRRNAGLGHCGAGGGVNGTAPSLSLETRLDAALAYALDHPEVPIVVSGSQGPGEEISEAACMYGWLAARGVRRSGSSWRTGPGIRRRTSAIPWRSWRSGGLRERGCGHQRLPPVPGGPPHGAHGQGHGPGGGPHAGQYLPLSVNYYIREAFAMAAELLLPNQ